MGRWLPVCGALAACAAPGSPPNPPGGLDAEGFRALMSRVAARAHRFEFLGGENGIEFPIHMTWHYLVLDPDTQVGAGEIHLWAETGSTTGL